MSNQVVLFLLLITVARVWSSPKVCPEPYQTWELGTKCFSFLASRAMWITANQACQQNDGKLAEIDNAFDAAFISSQALNTFVTYDDIDIWIGLNNLMDQTNQVYQWSDGANLTWSSWAISKYVGAIVSLKNKWASVLLGQVGVAFKFQWKPGGLIIFLIVIEAF